MSPEIEHAYSLLEVTPDVSDKEMRSAWRKLVRRYHPDLAKTDPEEASRRMADINAAFDAVAYHRSRKEEEAKKPRRQARSETPKAKPRAAKTARRKPAQDTQQTRAKAQAKPEQAKPETEQPKTAAKKSVKWTAREQGLVEKACAAFEHTRQKLNHAARRPTFSVCH